MTAVTGSTAQLRSMVTRDGTRLVYRDSGGPGTPLVMLHGLGQTQEAFRGQFDALGSDRRVITVDFRGHGSSDKPSHGYRIARLAADVGEFLDHLGLASVDALGWSMGASVWWSFIDLFGSSRIRRLVIVDQPTVIAKVPWMDADEQAAAGSMWDVPTLEKIVASQCSSAPPQVDVDSLRATYTGKMNPAVLNALVEGMRTGALFHIGKLLFDHATQDWRDVLPRIDVPTLVIGCEGSHVTVESQRNSARLIPHAQVHIFPEAVASSHFPFLQNAEAFNQVLEDYLDA